MRSDRVPSFGPAPSLACRAGVLERLERRQVQALVARLQVEEALGRDLVAGASCRLERRCADERICRFAERAGPGLDGPSQATWLAALELERDNLRAAMEWSLGHEPMTLRLVSAMWRFWQLRRRPSEGRDSR